MSNNYLKDVRDQYENYSYPPVDLALESKQLRITRLDMLGQMNDICFAGGKDFAKDFRVLVAGGGTGDAAIFMAEQLRALPAEIIYLDISSTSMKIAQERAKIRNLTNIKWINDSLLNISNLNLGKFDYINCSGVLHHLEDPDLGLKLLASSLKDEGAIGIMIYAKYGRMAVYQMQDALKLINKNESNKAEKLENCKYILKNLPASNWLLACAENISTEINSGDAAIYDLFLHSRDRAYSIPELYDFVESSGLKLKCLFPERQGENQYDPAVYIKDVGIIEKIKRLTLKEQCALAELLNGKIARHTFYCIN